VHSIKSYLFVDSAWWSRWSQIFRFRFEPNRGWKHWRTISAVFGSRFGRQILVCRKNCKTAISFAHIVIVLVVHNVILILDYLCYWNNKLSYLL